MAVTCWLTSLSTELAWRWLERLLAGSRQHSISPDLGPVQKKFMCRLEHNRPGTVSIAIAENDDDPLLRQRTNYR